MRHAVLGAGGVGGLLAAALSRSGCEVVALMREPTLLRYPGRFVVDSQVLGSFTAEVPAVAQLDREVDVVWVTAKSTSLASTSFRRSSAMLSGRIVARPPPMISERSHEHECSGVGTLGEGTA